MLSAVQKKEAKKSLHQLFGTGGEGFSMVYGDVYFSSSLERRYNMSILELKIASGYSKAPGHSKVKKIKRPGYRESVEWIAFNDDVDLCENDNYLVTIMMVADLWGKTPEQVTNAVERVREKEGC